MTSLQIARSGLTALNTGAAYHSATTPLIACAVPTGTRPTAAHP